MGGNFVPFFDSLTEAYLIPGLQSTYPHMGEARWFALKAASLVPSLFLAKKAQMESRDVTFSAEDTVLKHFNIQLELLRKRFVNHEIETESKKEAAAMLTALLQEIEIVTGGLSAILEDVEEERPELKKLKKQFARLKKEVQRAFNQKYKAKIAEKSSGVFNRDKYILFFTECILDTLKHGDDTVFVDDIVHDPDDSIYILKLSNDKGPLCQVCFNEDLLLISVLPADVETYPLHSRKFYVLLLEPIMDAVGHFFDVDRDIVVMPHHPTSERYKCQGFRMHDKKLVCYEVRFNTDNEKTSWWKDISSISTQAESNKGLDVFLGKEIRCVNKELPSLNGRTGIVLDYDVAGPDLTLLDVDFRRGLGTVTIKKQDVEFLN